ncbi:MAG: HU family DNA-binding protein [Muribaculaceae bacterium]|nr:HU family DNA-binding protein [Muribaculaceae bacterium]
MNKTELVNAIAAGANLTKVSAKAALEAGLAAIADALAKGDKIALIGFGTFAVADKKARVGVKPSTGEKIEIPAKKVVKFKAGAELADKVK